MITGRIRQLRIHRINTDVHAGMHARLGATWLTLLDSLWFVPGVITICGALLALITTQIDSTLVLHQLGAFSVFDALSFGDGADGARGVLSAIAGSVVTVIGVVFSITIVALQLASSQFTPRMLRGFTGDRLNQVVFGTYVGTFIYSLLVQRGIRSGVVLQPDAPVQDFVPALSVGVAITLAVICMGLLILFIHHVARSIQVWTVIDHITRETHVLIDDLFPFGMGLPFQGGPEALAISGDGQDLASHKAGYLQAVDGDTLFHLAHGRTTPVVIEMTHRIGDFILPGATLATFWPDDALDEHQQALLRRAFVLGPERTMQDDHELGFRQLVDIALRALSPAVNDPTTAITCIDRLAELLVHLGNREVPPRVRCDERGMVRFIARPCDFEHAVVLSFDQIRVYGRGDVFVVAHLLETLTKIAALVPFDPGGALARQAQATLNAAREAITDPLDQERIETAAAMAIAVADRIDWKDPIELQADGLSADGAGVAAGDTGIAANGAAAAPAPVTIRATPARASGPAGPAGIGSRLGR